MCSVVIASTPPSSPLVMLGGVRTATAARARVVAAVTRGSGLRASSMTSAQGLQGLSGSQAARCVPQFAFRTWGCVAGSARSAAGGVRGLASEAAPATGATKREDEVFMPTERKVGSAPRVPLMGLGRVCVSLCAREGVMVSAPQARRVPTPTATHHRERA